MNWDHARSANRKAVETAEAGDIFAAVRIYVHGGSYSYSPKEHRKLEKAERNSKPGQRHLGRHAVDARIFYTAYRRFFLPNAIGHAPGEKGTTNE
jgi:hypothetical protein